MEKILLIVSDWSLRQLYHELLMSKHFEVVPIDTTENALMLLVVQEFDCIVLYVQEESEAEVETFLLLRKKHQSWKEIKTVVLSGESELYQRSLLHSDLILNPLLDSPVQMIEKIMTFVREKELGTRNL